MTCLAIDRRDLAVRAGFAWKFSPCLVPKKIFQKMLQYLSQRIFRYVHRALNVDEKKLIAQFSGKLRDERFEPN